MLVHGQSCQTIWLPEGSEGIIRVIDQRKLPFFFVTEDLSTPAQVFEAIREMHVRGAPLIGIAGAAGMYLALTSWDHSEPLQDYLTKIAEYLKSARPTAVNLGWAIDRQVKVIGEAASLEEKISLSRELLEFMMEEDKEHCRKIGEIGLLLIEEISRKKLGEPVNIMTHCNAGWLACIDYGTATAPIYLAQEQGIPLHVWVSETRPRNQGARLTAWEMKEQGVPYTLIADNASGQLMQAGKVDMVIVGSDRTSLNGDVANKIGTYMKALAARDNQIPFYVALPSSSIDWTLENGKDIPIEEREANEVRYMEGLVGDSLQNMRMSPLGSRAANPAFDITPAALVTGIITERGLCRADRNEILSLFPEMINQLRKVT
jgi:methylthioribose-1-phosphate isomerase